MFNTWRMYRYKIDVLLSHVKMDKLAETFSSSKLIKSSKKAFKNKNMEYKIE